MSAPGTMYGSRPLEQLKVAELKEELRKRGLALKGIKRDLIERLEEALRRELQSGFYGSKLENLGTVELARQEKAESEGEGCRVERDTGGGLNSVMRDLADDGVDVKGDQEDPAIVVKNTDFQDSVTTFTPLEQELQSEHNVFSGKDGGGTNLVVSAFSGPQAERSKEKDDPKTPNDFDIKGEAEHISDVMENRHTDFEISRAASEASGLSPSVALFNVEAEPGINKFESDKCSKDVVMTEVKQPEVGDSRVEELGSYVVDPCMPTMQDLPRGSPLASEAPYGCNADEDIKHVWKSNPDVNVNMEETHVKSMCFDNDLAENFTRKKPKFDDISVEKPGHESVDVKDVNIDGEEEKNMDGGDKRQVMDMNEVKKKYQADFLLHTGKPAEPLDEEGKLKFDEILCEKICYEDMKPERRDEPAEPLDEERKLKFDGSLSDQICYEEMGVEPGHESVDAKDVSRDREEEKDTKCGDKGQVPDMNEVKKEYQVDSLIHTGETTEPFDEEGKLKFDEILSEKICYEDMEAERRDEPAELLDEEGKLKFDESLSNKICYEDMKSERRDGDGKGIDNRAKEQDAFLSKKEYDCMAVETDTKITTAQKRKDEDIDFESRQEPVKRQRRWNSWNKLTGEAIQPSATSTVKKVISSENREITAPSNASIKTTSSTTNRLVTSRPLRSDTITNRNSEKHRIVPPATRVPTPSLRIDRFLRPFTLKAVKELLSVRGIITEFWMDQIKTHCYVTYLSVDEAVATRNALYDLQWPPLFGNSLTAEFVEPEEVKIRCEGQFEKAALNPATTAQTGLFTPSPSQADPSVTPLSAQLVPLPLSEMERLAPVPRKPDAPIPTLDDFFKKTKAKPHIYYIPLTNEQVQQKARSKNWRNPW